MTTDGLLDQGADALHFGVVGDGDVTSQQIYSLSLSALGADRAAATPDATCLDLDPVVGFRAYYDGSFIVWGEARRAHEPMAVVVDLDGPCWPILLSQVRFALLRSLPGGARLLDYAVVTDQADHSTRAATVGLYDPRVPGRPTDGVLTAHENRGVATAVEPAAPAASAAPVAQGPQVPRLWVSNTGRVSCDEHGGGYLNASIEQHPRRRRHETPLDAWKDVRGADKHRYDPEEIASLACEEPRCRAHL